MPCSVCFTRQVANIWQAFCSQCTLVCVGEKWVQPMHVRVCLFTMSRRPLQPPTRQSCCQDSRNTDCFTLFAMCLKSRVQVAMTADDIWPGLLHKRRLLSKCQKNTSSTRIPLPPSQHHQPAASPPPPPHLVYTAPTVQSVARLSCGM